MTYNYLTPGLISQYMSVSSDHIMLKLQQSYSHITLLQATYYLSIIFFCYYSLFMYSFFNAFCCALVF